MKVFFLLLYCHLLYKSLECSCTTHTVVTSIFLSKKNVQAELTINSFSGMSLVNNCSLSFMKIYSLGRDPPFKAFILMVNSVCTFFCINTYLQQLWKRPLLFHLPSFHHQAFMTLGKRRSCVARLELLKRLYTYSQTYLSAFSSFLA